MLTANGAQSLNEIKDTSSLKKKRRPRKKKTKKEFKDTKDMVTDTVLVSETSVKKKKPRRRRKSSKTNKAVSDKSILEKSTNVKAEKEDFSNAVKTEQNVTEGTQSIKSESISKTHIQSRSTPAAELDLSDVFKPQEGSKKRKRKRKKRKKNQVDTNTNGSQITSESKEEPVSKKIKLNQKNEDVGVGLEMEDINSTVVVKKKRRPRKKKPAKNSIKGPKLNEAHVKRQDSIRKSWGESKGKLWEDTRVEVIKDPFTCCYIPSFLSDPTYLSDVKEELAELELIAKNNDLYKFHQTSDLKNVTSPYIAGLRHFLYGEFREWLKQVTGIPLTDKVDMGCSRYEYTDVLLCHDDELEGRRIAYILYLVPPWSQDDGGTLDLYTTGEHGQPSNIVRSLVPEWNTFACFEVSPISFHQVSEVLSQDKVRLSINGWFHGPPTQYPERYCCYPPTPLFPGHIEEEELYAWVNHIYLDEKTQQQIRRKFRTDSAIELDNFVTEDKYEELSKALKEEGLTWEKIGPANKQHSHILNIDSSPEVVKSCAELLKSEAFFLILSQLTGLKLHKLVPPDSEPDSDDESENGGKNEKEPNPCLSLNIHRWGHGSYTLVRDDCVETTSALDAHLFVNVAGSWSQEHGGFISYITKDEDEELLTVLPRANCLALVYRDAETLKFTKHINAGVTKVEEPDSTYHTFSSVYYE